MTVTLYGSSVASTTLTTANQLSTTTGGTETSKTTTASDSAGTNQYYMEIWSQGGTVGDSAAIPAPTGHGFLYDSTALEGQTIAAGNWSASFRENDTAGFSGVTMIIRAYKRSSSATYTSIGSMQVTGQSMSSTTTTYTIANTSFVSMAFGTGDKLYIDHLILPTTGHWSGDPIKLFLSNSATAGVANDFQITMPSYASSGTTVTKTLPTRFRLRVQRSLTMVTRFVQRVQASRTLPTRFLERTQKSLVLPSRFLERVGVSKTLQTRAKVRVQNALTTPFRFVMRRYAVAIRFRALIRLLVSRTVPTRVLVRVQRTLTTPFRFVMKRYTLLLRFRVLIRVLKSATLPTRVLVRTKATRTLPARFVERVANSVTIAFRFRLGLQATAKSLLTRFRLRSPNATTIAFRFRLAGTLLASGGFGLFANGSGTAKFDSFRVTQYPDPSLDLSTTGRLGSSLTQWGATTPPNTSLAVAVSTDGVAFSAATNGGALPGFYAQPLPAIDFFVVNTAANYTATNRTGGAVATATFDTTNSRLALTGGTNALYVNSSINRADVDLLCVFDQSDAGGLAWRYSNGNTFYYLQIADGSSSAATPNTLTLCEVSSNVRTQFAQASVTMTRGKYYTVRVIMAGGMITVSLDGVQVLTYTDSTPLPAGLMGFYSNGGSTGSRYYQLRLQPLGDDLTGKRLYTQETLTTTDASVSAQMTDFLVSTRGPQLASGALIPALHDPTRPFAEYFSREFDTLVQASATSAADYYWNIDQNGATTFVNRQAVPAPWCLASADCLNTPTVAPTISADLYRNRTTITNCTAVTNQLAETKVADGTATSWQMAYPLYSAPTISVQGVAKTVGLQGIDTGKDLYWQPGSTAIGQDSSATKITSGYTLQFSFVGQYVKNVTRDNLAEQATRRAQEPGTTGIIEAWEDGQGMLEANAITYADGLNARYANNKAVEIVANTERSGLATGMLLSVFLPEHGLVNQQLLITKISTTGQQQLDGSVRYEYQVTATNGPDLSNWSAVFF